MKKKKKTEVENLSRKVEIDVSGAIAQTSVTSVFALSNEIKFSVAISPKVKKFALSYFRQTTDKRAHDTFYFRLYIAGLISLISSHLSQIDDLVLDTELYGQDGRITQELHDYFGKRLDTRSIAFKQIGRKSSAHVLAKSVFLGEKSPNKILGLEDLKILLKRKKIGTPKVKITS